MASTLILRRPGAEPIPTAIGYFAFLQMDGETPLGEIARRIDQRFEEAGVLICITSCGWLSSFGPGSSCSRTSGSCHVALGAGIRARKRLGRCQRSASKPPQ